MVMNDGFILQTIAEPLMKEAYKQNGGSKEARSKLRNLVTKQVKSTLALTDANLTEAGTVVRCIRCWLSNCQ